VSEHQTEEAVADVADAQSAENVESTQSVESAVSVEKAEVEETDVDETVVVEVAEVTAVEVAQNAGADETVVEVAEVEVAEADAAAPPAPTGDGFASPDSSTQAVAFQSPEWTGPGFPDLPPAKPKRRVPWRWLGALVTAGAVGVGCAFAVMAPQRTDLPGLKTPSDGRYTFAALSLPTLAPGQAAPGDPSNLGGQHLADIRKLLLPAPQGAVSDHALTLADGWLPLADSLKLTWSPSAQVDFGHYGWRHTAAESWKTTDGAETKIYLLQFDSAANAALAQPTLEDMTGEPDGATTSSFNLSAAQSLDYYRSVKGPTTTWYGIALIHDTVLEIVYTEPTPVGFAPFQQEFSLQAQLLE
jgi:hypothetical protein